MKVEIDGLGDAGVVAFRQPDKARVKRKYGDGPKSYCAHRAGVLVDEQAREIECARCGAILDPVSVLVQMAQQEATDDRRVSEAAEVEMLLLWLTAQEGGRLVITRGRSEARAAGVVKSTSASVGGHLHRIFELLHLVRGTVEWAKQGAGK